MIMTKVISVINQKGGVGKTTTAINLAYYLSKRGLKVLLIDFDPQGNATSGLGMDKTGLRLTMSDVMTGGTKMGEVIQETEFKDLSVAPATPELANTEIEMNLMRGKFVQLRKAVNEVKAEYDYVVIDSAPSLSLLTVNGMIASNYLLLPVQTEFYALEGVAQLLESMKLVKQKLNPNLKLLGVVATMYNKNTKLSQQVLEEVKKYFKSKVFETVIPRNVRLAEAPSHGVPIGVYDRFSAGHRAYKALAKEVEERVK